MTRCSVGQRVQSIETGMVGTVTRTWNMSVGEWWIEVKWDDSTMEATEVEPIDFDD
jgi:hypothetical protein